MSRSHPGRDIDWSQGGVMTSNGDWMTFNTALNTIAHA